jgi:hypothetical protein
MICGRWKLIKRLPGKRRPPWLCVCACGTEKNVDHFSLKNGVSRSCGCLQVELSEALHTTHGHSVRKTPTPEYRTWCEISKRTTLKSFPLAHRYSGRGIRMCQAWRDSYAQFFADVGPKPTPRHSIDRKDNNGHYSCGKCPECIAKGWPANCRWATMTEQARNKSNNKKISFKGETKTLAEWAESTGMKLGTLASRLSEYGYSPAAAITFPIRATQKCPRADIPSIARAFPGREEVESSAPAEGR